MSSPVISQSNLAHQHSPLTSSVPMFHSLFSQQPPIIGSPNTISNRLPIPMRLPGQLQDPNPFWSPFSPPPPISKEKFEPLSNRPDFNNKSPNLGPHPFSRIGIPPSSFMSGTRIPKFDPLEGQLQDMLRFNMERYGGGAFDTIECARRVREILSVHNIGQRLFAKYVLGLSQGTVSELLSKPKCWEKLTEKGRDSYRKMHAWVYDERAVGMLKTLIPRKSELVRTSASASSALQAQLYTQSEEEAKRRFRSMSQIMADSKDYSESPPLTMSPEVLLKKSRIFVKSILITWLQYYITYIYFLPLFRLRKVQTYYL